MIHSHDLLIIIDTHAILSGICNELSWSFKAGLSEISLQLDEYGDKLSNNFITTAYDKGDAYA